MQLPRGGSSAMHGRQMQPSSFSLHRLVVLPRFRGAFPAPAVFVDRKAQLRHRRGGDRMVDAAAMAGPGAQVMSWMR